VHNVYGIKLQSRIFFDIRRDVTYDTLPIWAYNQHRAMYTRWANTSSFVQMSRRHCSIASAIATTTMKHATSWQMLYWWRHGSKFLGIRCRR